MAMYDVMYPKEYLVNGATKTAWVRVGAAWDARSGNGLSMQLDTLPVRGDWDGRLMLFPARGQPGGFTGRTEEDINRELATAARTPGADDDIPF